MKIERIQPVRRLVEALQAILIIGLPFLKIKGESALRFDIPSLRLHFFGADIWMEEFFIVLIAVIFLTFLIVFITLMFGRIWCGWLCPQTVLVDFTRYVDRAFSKNIVYKIASYAAVFLISIIVAASLIWYFVSPYEFFDRLFESNLGEIIWGFWIVLTAIIFLNFAFLRHKFCATVCPYAKLQSALFDKKTLVIAFDPNRKEECMECMACVRTCPVGIDIRKGLNQACINCAECIDKCAEMMAKRQKKSLIGYFFGFPDGLAGDTGKIFRLNAVMIGLLTIAFFIFLLYLSFTRIELNMTVLPNYSYSPKTTAEGNIVNSFILAIENMGKEDEEFNITVRAQSGIIKITPDRVSVKAGEHKKITAFVFADKTDASVEITVRSERHEKLTVTKKANIINLER
jgi:cytochrome c oxidase accessory protein FixG